VIVVGILVALLVDNWVSSATDRRFEREYVGRLQQEVSYHIEELTYISSVSEEATAYVDSLLHPGFVETVDDPGLVTALMRAGNQRAPDLVRSTFQELVSSGRLRVIRSYEVRVALAEYDRVVAESLDFWDKVHPAFSDWVSERIPPEVAEDWFLDCTTGSFNEVVNPGPCGLDLYGWRSGSVREEITEEVTRRALRLHRRRVGGGAFIAGGVLLPAAEVLRQALDDEVIRLGG
jgi:hypothetical protein